MENNCGAKRSCGAGVPPVEQTSGHPARIGHTNYMHHSLVRDEFAKNRQDLTRICEKQAGFAKNRQDFTRICEKTGRI
jgi:hypothetical protein